MSGNEQVAANCGKQSGISKIDRERGRGRERERVEREASTLPLCSIMHFERGRREWNGLGCLGLSRLSPWLKTLCLMPVILQGFALQSHCGAAGERIQWTWSTDDALPQQQRAGLCARGCVQGSESIKVSLLEQQSPKPLTRWNLSQFTKTGDGVSTTRPQMGRRQPTSSSFRFRLRIRVQV